MSNIFGTVPGSGPHPPFVVRAAKTQGWEPSDAEGFLLKTLFTDPSTGARTILMQVTPGAHAGPHAHEHVEHVYVLDGSFRDEYGTYRRGDYLMRIPGAVHSAQSDDGATMLLMYTCPPGSTD